MSSRVAIISLGCPRNLVDSETILAGLRKKDIRIVELNQADTVIVNTCAFIKEAKQESVRTILQLLDLKKQGQIKKIIVYGCLPQRYKDELHKNLSGVDAFVGRLSIDKEPSAGHRLTERHYAYIKIAEGCGNRCSYCVIPAIKGPLVSRPQPSIIEQARALDEQGVKEIILVGQDISLYGAERHKKCMLAGLLRDILKNTHHIQWMRLLYLHPGHISDELIDLIASEKRICKYVDLPIQHINDRILRLMNRGTGRKAIEALIKKIREKIPGVFLRTSVIVGFPSETEKEFRELLDFMAEIKFERLGAFLYSREEGTPAFDFKGQVHHKTKQSRFDRLMRLQRQISGTVNSRLLGSVRECIIDAQDEDSPGVFLGRLQQDAPEVDGTVFVHSARPLAAGRILDVEITDTLEYDLVAKPAGEKK